MTAAPGLHLSSAGSYPSIGDSPELQALRRTIAALDRGERSHAISSTFKMKSPATLSPSK